jgi:hypothetical protein
MQKYFTLKTSRVISYPHILVYYIYDQFIPPPPPPWRVVEGNGYNMKIIKITNDGGEGEGLTVDL